MNSTLLIVVLAVLAVLNIASFSFMAYDKHCARNGKWRVPEKTLFGSTALFGGLGGVLGMILCHHKTKHWYFVVFFPLLLIAQAAILYFGYRWLSGV